MTKAKFVPILRTTDGLNNTVDPARLTFDPRTGVTELAQAVNVDIDRSGRITRRLGRTHKRTENARCGFAHGETCLFVSGSTLYQMYQDYSVVALRTDLTPGLRMRYAPIAGRIYYVNGAQKGFVYKGANFVWSKGNYSVQHATPRVFSDPPNGHLVSWFAGRALIARDNAIFASEPSFYGVFDLHNAKMIRDRITMLRPTPGGLWVGTTTQVLFYRGNHWEGLVREPKAEYGVLEGSDTPCDGEKLGASGETIIFTTPQGICVGEHGGNFRNLTFNKLTFPTGRYGSATVAGDRYIVLTEG